MTRNFQILAIRALSVYAWGLAGLFLLALLANPSLLQARGKGKLGKARDLTKWEKHLRKLDRRQSIKQDRPAEGIARGMVVAYGHHINPPFKFEYREKTLYVNGVQLIPSPFSLREHEKSVTALGADRKRLYEDAQKIWTAVDGMYVAGNSNEEILEFIMSHEDIIAEAKWRGNRAIAIRYQGDTEFSSGLEFSEPRGTRRPTRPAPRSEQRKRMYRAEQINRFENHLKKDGCIFFQSDNGVLYLPSNRKKIVEVMLRKDIPDDEKIEELSEILGGNEIAALDLMANYRADQWERKE